MYSYYIFGVPDKDGKKWTFTAYGIWWFRCDDAAYFVCHDALHSSPIKMRKIKSHHHMGRGALARRTFRTPHATIHIFVSSVCRCKWLIRNAPRAKGINWYVENLSVMKMIDMWWQIELVPDAHQATSDSIKSLIANIRRTTNSLLFETENFASTQTATNSQHHCSVCARVAQTNHTKLYQSL